MYGYYGPQGSGYVFFLLNQSNNQTNFVRIEKISERNYGIAIPIDLKYYPFTDRFFRAYAITAIENCFSLKDRKQVDFYSDGMEQYETQVLSNFNREGHYFLKWSAGAGFRLGSEEKGLNLHFEMKLPIYLTSGPTGILKQNFVGVQIQIGVLVRIKGKKDE